jgi:endonuclease/exonuclease/phosphatase family metal-dependent hydrolase
MKTTRKRRLLWKSLNVLFIVALLLSYLARYISPTWLWFPAFFGLMYPFLLLVNVSFMLLWMFGRRWFFIYSLVAILLGFSFPGYFMGVGRNVEFADEHKSFKVMSYNVHDFDYYAHQYGADHVAFDTISAFLKREKADVVAFQEFYSQDFDLQNSTWVKLRARGIYLFGYRHKYNQHSKKMYMAIMSKYPILKKGVVDIAPGNLDITGLYADINIKGTLVRFYSVHLASMGVTSESKYLENSYDLFKEEDVKKAATGARRIIQAMRKGYEKRAEQVKILRAHMDNSPYPVVLMGDFNDTPISYTHRILSRKMKDAFQVSGNGISNTYNGSIPSFRIDYILYDKHFESRSYERIKLKASDHYPITAVLHLKEQ